jgi:hypothetical protein
VRRVLAALIALSVCSLQAQAMAFHVHRAPDHEREARHAHAPAIHHHDHHTADPDHPLTIEDDDESASVLTLTVAPAAHVDSPPVAGAVDDVALLERVIVFVGHIDALDVRSHGPPALHRPFYRGPPIPSPV